jgi:tetratricopeptide (TPR) repeat protein
MKRQGGPHIDPQIDRGFFAARAGVNGDRVVCKARGEDHANLPDMIRNSLIISCAWKPRGITMDVWKQWKRLAGMSLLMVLADWTTAATSTEMPSAMQNGAHPSQVAQPPTHPMPFAGMGRTAFVYSVDDTRAFLVKVKAAEAISNPMQRCLTYPDPPNSHWSYPAVVAYCRYHMQRVISFADVQKLIQTGHAADLDYQLEQDLQAQINKPAAPGVLDRTYFNDFDNDSFDVRSTLDAWKRASPSSAFAYAASGMAYVAMAANARGAAYIRDTPQSNIDAMDRLLAQADTDLQRAVALNPKVTPAYASMINAGSMSLGDDYTINAAKRGLAAAPDNYSIYGMLSSAVEPKWGGSLEAMDHVAAQAQVYVKRNPLLTIMLSAEPAYRYDVCNCESSANWSAFPVVFDNVSSTTLLSNAGFAASENGHPELAVIYLSEVMRFQPGSWGARRRRDFELPALGESGMAMEDANRLIADNPQIAANYRLRGDIYMSLMDYPLAEKDLERALAMAPDNIEVLSSLGNLYTNLTHEWDKAWDIADRIIGKYPGSPGGWAMRATIVENQPRADLSATYQYFVDHFGDDPTMQWHISRMRELLAKSSQPVPASRNSQHP